VKMRDHAYGAGSAVYDAVGATRVFHTPPYPSTHNLGTNRMSEKPGDGVVNKFGQSHDIANLFVSDGSQFTTGGAENPEAWTDRSVGCPPSPRGPMFSWVIASRIVALPSRL